LALEGRLARPVRSCLQSEKPSTKDTILGVAVCSVVSFVTIEVVWSTRTTGREARGRTSVLVHALLPRTSIFFSPRDLSMEINLLSVIREGGLGFRT